MTRAWTRRRVFCEYKPDPADVVEGKSAGSGHSSDVAEAPRC